MQIQFPPTSRLLVLKRKISKAWAPDETELVWLNSFLMIFATVCDFAPASMEVHNTPFERPQVAEKWLGAESKKLRMLVE